MRPDKVSALMLLRLNSKTVESMKKKKSIKTVFTPEQIENLISVDFEDDPNYNYVDGDDEEEEEELEYVEDMDNEMDGNDLEEVTTKSEDVDVPLPPEV